MKELTREEVEMTGRNAQHLEKEELQIPDYECNVQSLADAIGKVKRQANWKLAGFMYNVLNNCDIIDIGMAAALNETPAQEPSRISNATNKPKKKKGKVSGYNVFIGKCMKEGKGMSSCATEYKTLSDSQKQQLKESAKIRNEEKA